MTVAAEAARDVTEGRADPITAARRIWRIARLAPLGAPVTGFVGLPSEWEDGAEHRGAYEACIGHDAGPARRRTVITRY